MEFAIDPPIPSTLAVRDSAQRFPVRRIYCVGRNYAAHAREMGHDPQREPPFFFSKPADAIVESGTAIPFPVATQDLHHEVELVVALGRGGADITVAAALSHVWGYGVGLDLTRRDLQAVAKKLGRPWDLAKGFDHSAPCSALAPASVIGHPQHGTIALTINGETRQHGDLGDQIWGVAETIAILSTLVTLEPGDLIFTGTPDGVGAIHPGDHLVGTIDGVGSLDVTIGTATAA
ncbi:MAG: fumarylacetoacetate hydrolase family protein [Azospirillaceae bacterium]|nr:fumarylacetoacetate hydrolase family protein [Azospirillaceae bacterium]